MTGYNFQVILQEMARTTKKLPGSRFRYAHGEINLLLEVERHLSGGVYLCRAVNEPFEFEGVKYDSDFAGETFKVHCDDIERAIRNDEYAAEQKRNHEAFYANLELGSIVHYDNGNGSYVRAEVVIAESLRTGIDHFRVKVGERCLREVALVGTWHEYDMRPNSYHVQSVAAGRLFRPHETCIWEHSRKGPDPRDLPAVVTSSTVSAFAPAA